MKVLNDIKLDFKDVLIVPQKTTLKSRSEVNLIRNFKFKNNIEWNGIPIMVSNMDTTGTFDMANKLFTMNIFTCIHKYYSLNEWLSFYNLWINHNPNIFNYISVTSGISDSDLEKLDEILKYIPEIKFISLDVANGYMTHFIEKVKYISNKYSDKVIIAGTVVTPELVEELINNGASIVRVGIGSGSVCTTRIKSGVGYPQFSTIIECCEAAHKLGGYIISDGGTTCPGDFSKALGGGADFVMAGGYFSGHHESAGNIIDIDKKKYKEFYGMSSENAMNKYSNGVAKYRSSEGKRVLIPYKGMVENTIKDLLGGIRSTCTYIGCSSIENISNNITFIKVSQQSNEIYGKN